MEKGKLPLRSAFIDVARPRVSVDVEKYKAFLDGSDMTESQKEEFLQALWSIVVTFAELGFGVHPLQQVCDDDSESEPGRKDKEFEIS